MPSPRWVTVLVACAVLTACADDAGDDPTPTSPSTSPTPGVTTGPPPTATITPAPAPSPRPITIAFAGDVHFEGALEARLRDPASALDPVAGQLAAADLTVVNLETSIGLGGTPQPKRFTFQAPPSALTALAHAGVDVVTMANNHGMDFGPDGLAESLAAAEAAANAEPPLVVVGIGADADDAFAPARHEIDGTVVATLGASIAALDPTADPTGQWAAGEHRPGVADAVDPGRLLDAVRTARQGADVVVVYLHWGVQGESCPSGDQQRLAAALADAGATVVVGSHAHRLQGAGRLGDTYVAYGLGNFVWYTSSPATSATGLLTLTVADGRVVREQWAPARIGAGGVPEFASGAGATELADSFAALRDCAGLAPL